MNFEWANKIAKNALKSAQKRIDSVLDIEAEDEEETTDINLSKILPPVATTSGAADQWESNDFTEPFPSFSTDDSHFEGSVIEAKKSENCSSADEWQSSWNSPDDAVCSGDDRDIVPSNEIEKSHSTDEMTSSYDCKLPEQTYETRSQNNRSHDETQTIISSDIEVLRLNEPWSAANSISHKDLEISIPDVSSLEPTQASVEFLKAQNSHSTVAEIAKLKLTIQHQERRIGDLQAQNLRLQRKSDEMLNLKAAISQQTSTEAKLLKKLTEKEAELAELLQEGEKLAETNGKMAKEIKRLKSNLNEQEQLAKKGAQAEIDRDLAREEIRGLSVENNKLRATIKTMEAEMSKIKTADEVLMNDLKKREEKFDKVLVDLNRTEAQRNELVELNQRLESIISEMKIQAEKREYSSKEIEEITRGLNSALDEKRLKIEQQANYIESLEKRLSEMMDSLRNTAETVASANAPLLESIQRLEAELSLQEQRYSSYVQDSERRVDFLIKEKDKLEQQNDELNSYLSKLKSDVVESSEIQTKLSETLKNTEDKNMWLEKELKVLQRLNEDMKRSLNDKKSDLDKLYLRMREETENAEQIIMEKQSQIDFLSSQCKQFEEDLNNLRRKMLDKSEKSEIREITTSSIDVVPNEPTPYISASAAQIELADVISKYDQSMRHISLLQAKLFSFEEERSLLTSLQQQLLDLRMRYESLLEAHGEKIERIEELELDLTDVKKLLKDQMEFFLGKN
ncbi:unnamed protein product [Dracunculus medinensis]|uniref:TMF_TATA_bd domain-containing protein n=1 Tax=Dracunculus medinensis TaxID=318479 RepID=A0A0N4UBE0_DRAME|nr:unnamed protein product [Dracunculus medinensis]